MLDPNTIIDQYYIGEPAVSYYIEDGDDKILFDTGYSDIFIKNAEKMNIDLSKINKIIISHGHNDHTGGLKYYFESIKNNNVKLIAHPGCFEEKYCDDEYWCIYEQGRFKLCLQFNANRGSNANKRQYNISRRNTSN